MKKQLIFVLLALLVLMLLAACATPPTVAPPTPVPAQPTTAPAPAQPTTTPVAAQPAATQVHSQGPLFEPAPDSPVTVGPGPGQVVLADINRDGHLDMVTRHLLNQSVAVLLGDGRGRFAPVAEGPMSFGYQPGAMALGDVNNDSILDLGLASRYGDREIVDIFLGNGKGQFGRVAGSPFTASASIEFYKPSLYLVDVNEDGKLDIVTANGQRNTLEILFGDGRGAFSPGAIVSLESSPDLYSFALGDVDGDGHLDLVTATSAGEPGVGPGRVATRRGDGSGAFKDVSGSPLSVSPGPHVVTLADVNGDRRLDVVMSHSNNHLTLLLNSGDGLFAPAPASPYRLGTLAWHSSSPTSTETKGPISLRPPSIASLCSSATSMGSSLHLARRSMPDPARTTSPWGTSMRMANSTSRRPALKVMP
jgi:hypothetical protein